MDKRLDANVFAVIFVGLLFVAAVWAAYPAVTSVMQENEDQRTAFSEGKKVEASVEDKEIVKGGGTSFLSFEDDKFFLLVQKDGLKKKVLVDKERYDKLQVADSVKAAVYKNKLYVEGDKAALDD
ncbi:hypothetical protein [Bacillus sp. NEAU-Y102]